MKRKRPKDLPNPPKVDRQAQKEARRQRQAQFEQAMYLARQYELGNMKRRVQLEWVRTSAVAAILVLLVLRWVLGGTP